MKAIIIGASSGIGRALAHQLAAEGYELGLLARRHELLEEVRRELPGPAVVRTFDVTAPTAGADLEALLRELAPVDLVVISAGTGELNPELRWEAERRTIDVNVVGFAALAGAATNFFIGQGYGQLVGISSVAAVRGNGASPAYGASKAFVASYLAALRHKVAKLKLPIHILDVRPGFVDTPMAQGEGLFWVASPAKAAAQIGHHIRRRAALAYVTRRWRAVAWVLLLLPEWLYGKL